MKTIFLLIATLVLSTSAFAGMIVDRANNMKLVSTCIELDPSGDEGACSVIEVTGAINKKFVLSNVEYGDFRETKNQRTVHLIKFLFNFASNRTKTVSHTQFHDIINQLN